MNVPSIISYTLIPRAVCQYCLDSAVCYDCGGRSPCNECEDGQCAHCVDGRETWLMLEANGVTRGSCLTHREARDWVATGALPEWWQGYYGEVAK